MSDNIRTSKNKNRIINWVFERNFGYEDMKKNVHNYRKTLYWGDIKNDEMREFIYSFNKNYIIYINIENGIKDHFGI